MYVCAVVVVAGVVFALIIIGRQKSVNILKLKMRVQKQECGWLSFSLWHHQSRETAFKPLQEDGSRRKSGGGPRAAVCFAARQVTRT